MNINVKTDKKISNHCKVIRDMKIHDPSNNIIKLDNNENPLGMSHKTLMAAIEATLKNSSRYPDNKALHLKEILSETLKINVGQIIIGNGSSEILSIIVRTFVNEGDEVIIPEYSFIAYEMLAQARGAQVVKVPPISWQCNLEGILEKINAKTKIIMLANPNNPTGTYVNFSDLTDFIKKIPCTVITFIDEAYFEYVDVQNHKSALTLINKHSNVIVVRSFSKIYGLAGLRIGYAVANADLITLFDRFRQPFNVNAVAMAAAATALTDAEHLNNSRVLNKQVLGKLKNGINNLGFNWIPSEANFLTINFGQKSKLIYENLLKKGIFVRALDDYQMQEYLRVTTGLKQDNNIFLEMLSEIVKLDL